MKIENQVCGIENSKKLKQLGINAEPLFWHVIDIDPITPKDIIQKWQHSHFDICEKYPAYTVAELFKLLPPDLENEDLDTYWPFVGYVDDNVHFDYGCVDETENSVNYRYKNMSLTDGWFKSLPEGMSEYLIWLIENKIISSESCNNRLSE